MGFRCEVTLFLGLFVNEATLLFIILMKNKKIGAPLLCILTFEKYYSIDWNIFILDRAGLWLKLVLYFQESFSSDVCEVTAFSLSFLFTSYCIPSNGFLGIPEMSLRIIKKSTFSVSSLCLELYQKGQCVHRKCCIQLKALDKFL